VVTGLSTNDGTLTIIVSSASTWSVAGVDIWQVGSQDPGAQPQLADVAIAASLTREPLTSNALRPIVQEAIARWAATGRSAAEVAKLAAVPFHIVDLGAASQELGLDHLGYIEIDDDAQGSDWYIDATPHEDSEFALRIGAHERDAANGSPAAG